MALQSPKNILLFADWFEPGYKAGGPIRSCLNFVQQMKDVYTIYVFTTDRDLDARAPYKEVITDQWVPFEPGIQIFYCSPPLLTWKHIRKQVTALQPDFVYLNSMFSRYCTIYPLLMKRQGIITGKVILSPRGMLRSSALQFKNRKKKIFLAAFKLLGLPELIAFHATDETEQQDVQRQFGRQTQVVLAPNFAGKINDYPGTINKQEGDLSIIFVGRLHPIKNLDYLLNLLPQVPGQITLTIVGNEEDEAFVGLCKKIIAGYPPRIRVNFAGEIPNRKLPGIIAQHHIFALPTKGENFGHAIFEALAAGKPVLISDQTPWRNLSGKQAGWDLDLQQPQAFVTALKQAATFNQPQYDTWCRAAWQYVSTTVDAPELKVKYYKLFS